MRFKSAITLIVSLFLGTSANAQFFTQGSEPSSVRWMHLDSPNYSVIYPQGLDSLARVYARTLEAARIPVSSGIGFVPNQNFKRRMPVILHAYTADANGMVTWTPRRAELQTGPSAFAPEAFPWEMQLCIHESRHVAQMQFTQAKPFVWLRYLTGELAAGALSSIYAGPAFFEGDAVVAETALSASGRGRTADFLEYYRVCADQDVSRDYWQWRYGSQRLYTPDHYTIGYLTMAGMRTVYDCPDFTERYFDRIRLHRGFAFWNLQKTVREVSGKSFKETFGEISENFSARWKAEADARAPFMPADRVSREPASFEEYLKFTGDGTDIFAVRRGMQSSAELTVLNGGRERRISRFSPSTSVLHYSKETGRLWWSEIRPDARWELRSSSDIRWCGKDGKMHTLTRGKRYYNPSPCGGELAVTEYPTEGGSRLVFLDGNDGSELRSIAAPDGMQIVESVFAGGKAYVSAITREGFGIYSAGDFSPVVEASPVKINRLSSEEGRILFISDRNGVNELYSVDPADRSVLQLTNTRCGIGDYCFMADSLYYNALLPEGRLVFRTGRSDLPSRPVDFSERHMYEDAGKLSAQTEAEVLPDSVSVTAEPAPYSKIAHLVRLHSWLPLYFNYDSVSELSLESIYRTAGLGATAFFQNDLGDAYGTVAYNARPDGGKWRHSGHLQFTYQGLYPVLDGSLDINARNALKYKLANDKEGIKMESRNSGSPSVNFSGRIYVPLKFNSGGWLRGAVPQLRVNASNDRYEGRTFTTLSASLRGYTMLRTPESCIWPRWGIGAEAGYLAEAGMSDAFRPTAYAHVYGYVPGIARTHGIKLAATSAFHTNGAPFCREALNTAPRGFGSSVSRFISTYPSRSIISVDYALPFASVDWGGLCPVAYVRNFEFIAHYDMAFFGGKAGHGNLFSAGADLTVRLGNFLWVPFATRLGVSFNWNGGSSFEVCEAKYDAGRTSVSLVFGIDL